MKYAHIIVNNRAVQTDKPFTYLIGDELLGIVKEGMRVIVPFGQGDKNIKGIVVRITEDYSGEYKLKSIIDVLDDKPLISKELLDLGFWMRENYLSSYLDALQPVLPPGDFKEITTFISLKDFDGEEINLDEDEGKIIAYIRDKGVVEREALKKDFRILGMNELLNGLEEKGIIDIDIDITTTVNKKTESWVKVVLVENLTLEEKLELIGTRAYKQREIMEYLEENSPVKLKELLLKLDTTSSTVRALEDRNLIKRYDKVVNREPIDEKVDYYEKHRLNKEQLDVFSKILDISRGLNGGGRFLLHGITGSGKTEIYLQLVEVMLELGKDSIILVPEISLTPQTIDRFVGRFGEEVAILHSRLNYGERFDEWRKIKQGEVKIVVGARSAIFAPFDNLGLVIIDEEHEGTYKSSKNPKYLTREVAEKRIELEGGMLLLGSATPAIDTYYLTEKKEYELLEMKNRVNEVALPEISIVDMREELNSGNRTIFSRKLNEEILRTLEEKKQVILFLNRRGFSTFVSCRTCGYVVECKDCDISMNYHRGTNILKCHYCGKTEKAPLVCPECESKYIKYFGIGTEQIETVTKQMYPEARVARMDADTMRNRKDYEDTLGDMKDGKIDILIGTQMISKGLDFENVTLVGIIAADTTLNLPDYRSPEKNFQLITQVGGRAGRGEYKGEVVLQTYSPEHYSIRCAKTHDYNSFYDMEIKLREEFLYPPFINLINILIFGEDSNKVVRLIKKIFDIIEDEAVWLGPKNGKRYMEGPYPSPIGKIKRNYRWQFILKVKDEDLDRTKDIIDKVCIENVYELNMEDIKMSIDINPDSIL